MEPKRAQWGSKVGFILAAAGSAVGLGNIWKFPGKAFEGGGGAYILIYLAIVLLIGIPVMLSELTIGRAAQANAQQHDAREREQPGGLRLAAVAAHRVDRIRARRKTGERREHQQRKHMQNHVHQPPYT